MSSRSRFVLEVLLHGQESSIMCLFLLDPLLDLKIHLLKRPVRSHGGVEHRLLSDLVLGGFHNLL